MTARSRIDVHIEQLVLTGFAADTGERIGQSLRGELEHLLTDGKHWPAMSADRSFVRAGTVELVPGATAEATGREIARAVYEELGS